jgi:hypothetical protein
MLVSPPSNEGKILVYDTTDRESFKSLNKWIEDINTHTTELQILVIAASKCD